MEDKNKFTDLKLPLPENPEKWKLNNSENKEYKYLGECNREVVDMLVDQINKLCAERIGKVLVDYCKNCKYWGDEFIMPADAPEEAKIDLKGKYRHCDHEDSPVVASPEDYGCVFSKKGDDNDSPRA